MKTRRRTIGSALALAAAQCAALVGISEPANADSDRITQGEAAAVYQAAGAGGGAILSRGHGRFVGAPANQNVAIRPYFDNNLHYCADDWHALWTRPAPEPASEHRTSAARSARCAFRAGRTTSAQGRTRPRPVTSGRSRAVSRPGGAATTAGTELTRRIAVAFRPAVLWSPSVASIVMSSV